MNKDTIVGAVKETAADIKGKVDHAVGNSKGEAKDATDALAGNVQKNYGKLKDTVKNG